ncbi:MAG: hypothetical protein H6581_23800 [Bacteroidia bacterium]|nr:hypothetical protein [Bacteroidia bacterium]
MQKTNFKQILTFLPLLLFTAFLACQPGQSAPDTIPLDGPTFEPDTTYQTKLEIFEQIYAERAEKGDTVPVRHEKLAAALPKTLAGYDLEFDDGNSFITGDFAFSEASRVFYQDEDGKGYVEFNLSDYSSDPAFIRNLIQRYNIADGIEMEGAVDSRLEPETGKTLVWTHFEKERKFVRLEAGIDYRFHLRIEASLQENTDFILECWKKVDLGIGE